MTTRTKLMMFLPLVILCGCSSITTKDLHVLNPNLTYSSSGDVDLVYRAPDFRMDGNVDAIVLEPVKVNMNGSQSLGAKNSSGDRNARSMDVIARRFAEKLEHELASEIREKTSYNLVRPGETVSGDTVALDVTVTELDPGNGFARWFIGAGAGASKVQVEGQLKNPEDELLLAFADRRYHSGNPTLGLNVSSLSDEYTLTAIRKEIADRIVSLLKPE